MWPMVLVSENGRIVLLRKCSRELGPGDKPRTPKLGVGSEPLSVRAGHRVLGSWKEPRPISYGQDV